MCTLAPLEMQQQLVDRAGMSLLAIQVLQEIRALTSHCLRHLELNVFALMPLMLGER